jgi:hypothetical protein
LSRYVKFKKSPILLIVYTLSSFVTVVEFNFAKSTVFGTPPIGRVQLPPIYNVPFESFSIDSTYPFGGATPSITGCHLVAPSTYFAKRAVFGTFPNLSENQV